MYNTKSCYVIKLLSLLSLILKSILFGILLDWNKFLST